MSDSIPAGLMKIKKHQAYLDKKWDELDAQGDNYSEHRFQRLIKFNNLIAASLFSRIKY